MVFRNGETRIESWVFPFIITGTLTDERKRSTDEENTTLLPIIINSSSSCVEISVDFVPHSTMMSEPFLLIVAFLTMSMILFP